MRKEMKLIYLFFLTIVVFLFSGCITKVYKTSVQTESAFQITSGKIVNFNKKTGEIVAQIQIDEVWGKGYIEHKSVTDISPFVLITGGLRGHFTDHFNAPYVETKMKHHSLSEFKDDLSVSLIGKPLDHSKEKVLLNIKTISIQNDTITVYVPKSIFIANKDKDIFLKIQLLRYNNELVSYKYSKHKEKLRNLLELLVTSSTSFMY